MYRLLVSDIDGTLVDGRQRIPPGNVGAVRALVARGIGFTLATGRIEEAVRPFLEELPITAPLILYNGAKIVDHRTLAPLREWFLTPGEIGRCLQAAAGLPMTPLLYTEGRCHVARVDEVSRRHARKDRITLWPVEDLGLLADRPASKVHFLADGVETADSAFSEYLSRLGLEDSLSCHAVRSEPTYLEVLPAGASKGAALLGLIATIGVAPDEVIAVGDSLNDLEMLAVAGLGVAVANAHPQVLARADYVSLACDEAAIDDVARRFLAL